MEVKPRHSKILIFDNVHLHLLLDRTVIATLTLPHVHLHIEIEKQQQNRTVQDGIQPPSPNPITPTFHKMHQQNPNMAQNVATQQHNLATHHERKAGAGEADRRPEPVAVDDGVNRRR